jgi:plasmid stabilization system protein ParE
MAEIRWTDEAVRWLEEIRDYVARDNPDAAHRTVAGIYKRVQILRDFPGIGQLYRDEPDGEVRILLHGHYRIAYLVSAHAVHILGVFHGAMDIARFLNSSD